MAFALGRSPTRIAFRAVPIDASAGFDRCRPCLDSNVEHYADPEHAHVVEQRFARSVPVTAGDLAPDFEGDTRAAAARIVDAFRATGKHLHYLDLTTPDMHGLGLATCRVWSPDTLGVCLPDAPPQLHRRFAAYGGFAHTEPHPYP